MSKLFSKLAEYFTANVLVMTGICAGDENKYGHVKHGCVFVATRTTVESGGKSQKAASTNQEHNTADLTEGSMPLLMNWLPVPVSG